MKSLLLGLLIVGTAPFASRSIANSWFSNGNSTSLSLDSNLCHPSESVNSCQSLVLSGEIVPTCETLGVANAKPRVALRRKSQLLKRSIPSQRTGLGLLADAPCDGAFPPTKFRWSMLKLGDGVGSDSSLWLQPIANLLLPSWTLQRCWHQSSVIKSKNSVCLSPWKKLLDGNSFHQTSLISSNFITHQNVRLDKPELKTLKSQLPQFPPLSRSSLIVSPPSNKLLPCSVVSKSNNHCLNSSKLANPAPKNERIASPFGWRKRPYSGLLQFHQGIDYGAPLGSPVVAAGNGIVTKVVSGCADFGNRWCGNQFGNWVEIDHGNGAVGIYGHLLNKSITVKEGMKVWRNQKIAQVGSSGWSTGAHLDFRLKVKGEYKNPADYVISNQ